MATIVEGSLTTPRLRIRRFDGSFGLSWVGILAMLCLLGPQVVLSQQQIVPAVVRGTPTDGETEVTRIPPARPPVESELAVTTMIPDGDYRVFSATVRCTAWTVGVEYARHSWGHLLKSQVDYVVEVIPVVLLSQPAVSDFWGNAKSPNQQLVYGMSVSPFGFRFLWRSNKAVRPYLMGKLGAAVFEKKALSQNASYTNFNVQAGFGVNFRLTNRVDLQVVPFQFFHVSNGYLAASNPGMDQLATKIGINYHLGKRGER
jgi:hypothetical protein